RNFRYSPVNSSPFLSTFFRLVQFPTAPVESRSFHSTSAPDDQLLRILTQLSISPGQLVSFSFNFLPSCSTPYRPHRITLIPFNFCARRSTFSDSHATFDIARSTRLFSFQLSSVLINSQLLRPLPPTESSSNLILTITFQQIPSLIK